ncbi:MAG TPA: XRE family transcriptional regulator [Anaerolineales bacterium]|nr:XRE family transcriptional regulator [Anaerolineales bacterium]
MGESVETHVGQAIWKLRKQRGLSLRSLASQCGLSITAISKIERGENSPTVASLHQLAAALEVPITDFFRQDVEQYVVYVKASQGAVLRSGGMQIESLGAGLPFQQLEPLKFTIEPAEKGDSEINDLEPVAHSGEEFVYCLKGKLDYTIDDQIYRLEPGDCLLFKASHPHSWRALGPENAEVLLVLQADETQPRPHNLFTD